MGAEIDRLEVQVEAQATKANNQLDKLVGKLDSLSNSLSHINSSGLAGLSNGVAKFAQASVHLSNVKTADFTRLIKNIQSLANLNTQQIYGAASAMRTLSTAINSLGGVSASSMQVADVAKSISKLGGANVQRAITNLPALATAMNDLMTTLSKAPSVNRNIIDMTNALANLASQVNRVGSSGNSIVNGMNRTGSAMARTKKQTLSLAAALGKFYASWWLVIRGASKLWDSIENSMNYVETLNYFDAAFGQVADSAVSQWEDAGYDSADAYYESFSSRAKELTSKMTGFNVNDNGTLTATGNTSLGINPTKLMNYQATFAQMSSSIGVASETSLLLSQALTEIGADLASVKNMDFDKVWKDMASGLAGMSRTLDKYGVNIRNVNLQQKLFDLGIEENITNLNQNDKALLRAIILLDSTKYAWGDLADTLNQPANQMRLLDSNLNNLSRTIGNLFLPVVSKVLPYVNGLVIGLQRLFTWVGNLIGIDISGITSAVGDSAVDVGELVGETDDLTGSLEEASKAADKLKKGIRGFDELEVITIQSDSDNALSSDGLQSGLLDEAFIKSFSEYQKVWDEAFANMENRANDFADKVEEFLQPVRDIIEDFAIGDFFKAGQDTSNLVAGIFNFFADAIDNVDWDAIGKNIGALLEGINWTDVLCSIGNFFENIFNAAVELWSASFESAPVETAIITALLGLKWTGIGNALLSSLLKSIKSKFSLKSILTLISGMSIGKNNFANTNFFSVIGTWIFDGISEVLSSMIPDEVFKFLSNLGAGLVTGAVSGSWFPGVGTVAGAIIGAIVAALNSIEIDGESVFANIVNSFKTGFEFLWKDTISEFKAASYWFEKIGKDFEEKDWLGIGEDILMGIVHGFVSFISIPIDPFKRLFEWIWGGICNIFGIHSPAKEMNPLGENILLGIVSGFNNSILEFTNAINSFWNQSVLPWFSETKWLNALSGISKAFIKTWNGIGTGISNIWNYIIITIKNKVNSIIYFINKMIGNISNGINNMIDSVNGLDFQIPDWIPEIGGKSFGLNIGHLSVPEIQYLATGAVIPPNKPFMAMLGDQRNGTNLEAPESLIRQIIHEEVSSYNNEVMSLLSEIAQNTKVTADKDFVISNETIGKGAKQYAIEYYNRTGNPAY